MGVDVRFVVYTHDADHARAGASAAFDRIAAIEQVASDWRPSSEVSLLCAAPPGQPFALSDDLFTLLETARRVSFASGGAFDVTIGPVTHLWRVARAAGTQPSPAQRSAAAARVDFRALTLDPARRTATLTRPGVMIDLGGVAQGYAAAEALQVLDAAGLHSCLVDLSGDIALGDPPSGTEGWRIAIPTADGWRTLSLSRCAVSTSGDTEQFEIVANRRESHIREPTTGQGVVGARSVTVIGPDAALCDALATAISVMGPSRGVRLAERAVGYEAVAIIEDDEGRLSENETSGMVAHPASTEPSAQAVGNRTDARRAPTHETPPPDASPAHISRTDQRTVPDRSRDRLRSGLGIRHPAPDPHCSARSSPARINQNINGIA